MPWNCRTCGSCYHETAWKCIRCQNVPGLERGYPKEVKEFFVARYSQGSFHFSLALAHHVGQLAVHGGKSLHAWEFLGWRHCDFCLVYQIWKEEQATLRQPN